MKLPNRRCKFRGRGACSESTKCTSQREQWSRGVENCSFAKLQSTYPRRRRVAAFSSSSWTSTVDWHRATDGGCPRPRTRVWTKTERARRCDREGGVSLSLFWYNSLLPRGRRECVCFSLRKAGHFRHNKQQSDFIALLPSMHFYSCVCRSWKMHAPRERSGAVCEGPKQPSVATTRFWNAKFLNAHFGYAIGAQMAWQLMALGLKNKNLSWCKHWRIVLFLLSGSFFKDFVDSTKI